MKDYAVITVRNSSTRLPNKAILEVQPGLKTIEAVIERAKLSGFPVVLATSTDASDDVFESIAQKNGIQIFRGALLNKIQRWYDCFEKFGIENGLLIDGDDLLYDFEIGKRAIAALKNSEAPMIKHPDNVMCGYFTYAVKKSALKEILKHTDSANTNTDVITEFVKKSGIAIETLPLNDWEKDKPYRLTLDYIEDLEFFSQTIAGTGIKANGKTITEFLDHHPEIVNINLHRQQDYLSNQKRFNEEVNQS